MTISLSASSVFAIVLSTLGSVALGIGVGISIQTEANRADLNMEVMRRMKVEEDLRRQAAPAKELPKKLQPRLAIE